MIRKKYKVSELAKDLKVTSKDLVETLKKYIDKPLKITTTLTKEEINIALEIYSQKNQVESFDGYFKMVKKYGDEKKSKLQTKKEDKDKNKNEIKDEKEDKDINDIKYEKEKKEDDLKKKDLKTKKEDSNKTKRMKSIKLIPKKQSSSINLVQEQERDFVDTKTSHVNFEKYDEKYEKIAGDDKLKDNFQNKQKFKKRSTQKNFKKRDMKETEAQRLQRLALERARKQKFKVTIPDNIVVSELASRLKANVTQVIKHLMDLGVMANVNESVDFDTASLVAQELGAIVEHEVTITIEDRLFEDQNYEEGELVKKDPVVVVVGHVDHGKTSLLDRIRNTNIISSESGGITQHIGAYKVSIGNGKGATFLDTPGHEAFTSMRMRGVNITDIAVLVVAADDGVMPQTVEAINHAKAAKVSIIVAINKIDKPQANVEKIKKELTEYGIVPEEWGGEVICVPVSAKTGEGVQQLLEMIDLVAEVKEIKAAKDCFAKGTVIEAYLDKGRGPVSTLLVQSGTLKTGDFLIAGTSVGRVRVMLNDKGKLVKKAGPSTPVEITGLSEVPLAGDVFNAVANEKLAKELVAKRKYNEKNKQFAENKINLDNIFSDVKKGEVKHVNIIIKADVQGSVEAIKHSLEKLSSDEIKINIIHSASGTVNEADVNLAVVSGAIVIGFNVRPNALVKSLAQSKGVEIRLYSVIYDVLQDIEKAMKGMLAPKQREVELGTAQVRQVYKISNVGTISGCYVMSGKISRKAQVRVVRDGVVIAQDLIRSLKRFKDDVKEVLKEFECGIGLTKFNDIKIGDVFEAFVMEEYSE